MDGERLGVGEATALILDGVAPLPAEQVRLPDAMGRVLAGDVVAPRDLPPWRNASMDGYAVLAADIAGASPAVPVTLAVVDEIPAGALPRRAIGRGEAARIMTGAPLPEGADTVVRVEDTDRGRTTVAVADSRDAGANIRPRGEDSRAGDVAVATGTLVTPGVLGLLAAVGAASVAVHRRPRVAMLSAGDELVPLAEYARAVEEQRVVDVNAVTLAALVTAAGGEVIDLGLAPDDPAAIRRRIARAPDHDVLLTSGGVSVGDHDHTRAVIRSLGGDILVHRLRIRPGAPLGFGRLGAARWVGLPGNPVSAMVTFELFVRPLVRRLAGASRPFRGTVPVMLRERIRTAAALTHFLRAVVTESGNGFDARLTGPQGSGLISSMARANALVIVPETVRDVPDGSSLRAILLDDRMHHSATQVA